jgi:hypothetical protein
MRRFFAAAALALAAVFGFVNSTTPVNAAGVASAAITQSNIQSAKVVQPARYRHRHRYGPRVYFSYGYPRHYRYYGRKRHYYGGHRHYRPHYRKHRHYGHHRRYRH